MNNVLNVVRALVGCAFLAQTATAGDWTGVDDFESHNDGDLVTKTQSWRPVASFEQAKIVMLEDGNHVAQIGPGQAIATSATQGNLSIPEGATGVIYLKFRSLSDSRYWGGAFGMTSRLPQSEDGINAGWTLGNPGQGSRPNATFAVLGEKPNDLILVNNRGRMNKSYGDAAPEIKPNVWYDLWVTIDNSRDEISMYIQGGDFKKRTELTHFRKSDANAFPFQTASASDLTQFVIMNPIEGTDYNPRSIQVDDINVILHSSPSAIASGH